MHVARFTVKCNNVLSSSPGITVYANAELGGLFPNNLGKMAGCTGEPGPVVVVLFDFIVPPGRRISGSSGVRLFKVVGQVFPTTRTVVVGATVNEFSLVC